MLNFAIISCINTHVSGEADFRIAGDDATPITLEDLTGHQRVLERGIGRVADLSVNKIAAGYRIAGRIISGSTAADSQCSPANLARLRTLLTRQWGILRRDHLNLISRAAQAALIGALFAWVDRGEPKFQPFPAMIATHWLRYDIAAHIMKREVPVFLRDPLGSRGMLVR